MSQPPVKFESIAQRYLRLSAERDSLQSKIRSGWYDPIWFEMAVPRIYALSTEIESLEKFNAE